MSRSFKKIPTYNSPSRKKFFVTKNKRAERKYVRIYLKKNNWDILPDRKEIGSGIWGSKHGACLGPRYFESKSKYHLSVYENANAENKYIFKKINKKGFDIMREIRRGFNYHQKYDLKDLDVDNYLSWDYHEVYNYVNSWFPVYNSSPIDSKFCDEKYIEEFYKRK